MSRRRKSQRALEFVADILASAPKPGDIVPATATRPPFRYLGDGKWEPVEDES